jgi:sulfatase modifying factor 1
MSCTSANSLKNGCCSPSALREAADLAPVKQVAAGQRDVQPQLDAVELPGGRFLMGTDFAEAFPDDGEGPIREVELSPFAISRTTVTNRQFARFVQDTGYVTEAEHFGWSFVFWGQVDPQRFRELVVDRVAAAPWWCKVPGAHWNVPAGPGSHIQHLGEHPVVHVSWNDARAYCAWTGQRLPTEAEWEYAARGGLVQKIYAWGDKLRPAGRHMCNIWQGEFPRVNTRDDGFAWTCPVDAFPANGYGLLSMTGNTWEWCADWFSAAAHGGGTPANPQGPSEGTGRVIRGGSFLCHKSYCNRYRVAARTQNTPDSATSHMSFRCAQSL